jgi:hypothetical protein
MDQNEYGLVYIVYNEYHVQSHKKKRHYKLLME